MDPLLWGPCVWDCLTALSVQGNVNALQAVLTLLKHHIPCSLCRTSLSLFFKEFPIETSIRDPLLYTWNMRDTVNRKLKRHLVSYDVFKERLHYLSNSLEKNSIHMMCFIYLHANRENEENFLPRLAMVFDTLCDILSQEHSSWMNVRKDTMGKSVEDALKMTCLTILKIDSMHSHYGNAFVAPTHNEGRVIKAKRHRRDQLTNL